MIYLLLSIICSASMAIVLKIFHTQTGNRYGILLGNYLTCILIAFIMLPEKGLVLAPAPETILCGVVGGFFFVVALVTMQSSIRANGAILTTAFSRLGLLIPLAVSIFVFGEKPDIRQFFGILLVLAALLYFRTQRDYRRGMAYPFAAALYCAGRFFWEFLRYYPPKMQHLVLGLTLWQASCLVVFIASVVSLVLLRKKQPAAAPKAVQHHRKKKK